MMGRFTWFNATALTLGFAFLYVPILLLMIYSFNESRLVTVWAGWSTKWYGEVLRDEQFLDAAWVTLRVAFLSATIATVLGTLAALTLVRAGRFKGRTLFSGMIYAPLVMPEVITGLSLLLLFISLDVTRGMGTIILAHTTFAMCYVSVVVSSRLVSFDQSLEEAAMDLGATPAETFRLVTLPIIAPAVISGWLLAFTLSLDDLVIASFTAGPSATTLPMKIFSAVRLGVSPEINALSTMLISVVTVGVITASLVSKRSAQRRLAQERAAEASGQWVWRGSTRRTSMPQLLSKAIGRRRSRGQMLRPLRLTRSQMLQSLAEATPGCRLRCIWLRPVFRPLFWKPTNPAGEHLGAMVGSRVWAALPCRGLCRFENLVGLGRRSFCTYRRMPCAAWNTLSIGWR